MAASIENYLKDLSKKYYLKNDSEEVRKIDTSVQTLFKNLNSYFKNNQIKKKFVFGSYDRDTILPRKYDSKSDVDVMIIFNHTSYERTPETYRKWLSDFANLYYANRYNSKVTKTFPTVTVELNHIKYDLVPAKEVQSLYSSYLYIPSSGGDWITTDPNDIKTKLVRANTTYSGIIRPIIRLFKAWNSNNLYPFDSYDLESRLLNINYFGDNVQTGFFYAVKSLTLPLFAAEWKKEKLEKLKKVCAEAENYLLLDMPASAKFELHRILPY